MSAASPNAAASTANSVVDELDPELTLLGAVLLDPRAFVKMTEIVGPDDFAAERNRLVWQAMLSLHLSGAAINAVTVRAHLNALGKLEQAGGAEWLSLLDVFVPLTAKDPAQYASLVRDASLNRRIGATGVQLVRLADAGIPLDAKLAELERLIGEIRTRRAKAEPLPWRTARQIGAETPERVEWTAWPLAAGGAVTLVSGPPKLAGKTTMVMAAVKSVLEGQPWLGEPTMRCPVIYLTEERPATLRLALDRVGLLEHDDLHLLPRRDVRLRWAAIVEEARAKAREVGAKMAVVDTYFAWTELSGDSENSAGDAGAATAPLLAMASDGLAVVVIAHDRKGGGAVGERVRGSSALTGAVDLIVAVTRHDAPTKRLLEMVGRLDVPETLVIDRTAEGYVSCGTLAAEEHERHEIDTRTTVERVVEAVPVGADNAISREDLVAKRGDVSRAEWETATQSAVDSERILSSGAGRKGSPRVYWRAPNSSQSGREESDLREESEDADSTWNQEVS